jgi:hypothetical protein
MPRSATGACRLAVYRNDRDGIDGFIPKAGLHTMFVNSGQDICGLLPLQRCPSTRQTTNDLSSDRHCLGSLTSRPDRLA